jgi:uncharacterized protein YigA (DUF484 family)
VSSTPAPLGGITEADIAHYLSNNPAFFERHAELMASITLTSPHGQRAVSLQERQMEMLRERIKGLEMRMVEMIRHGHEFRIPQAALRLWDVAPEHAAQPWAQATGDDARAFAASLSQPYCGANSGLEPAAWLDDGSPVASLAMLPLRQGHGERQNCFGLLVLGSPDPARYTADMGTDFLARIGEVASAALSRLSAPVVA